MEKIDPEPAIRRLLQIMSRLRSPGGCPWDAAQTPETLQPYLLEETYEVLQALDQGEPEAICEELGDLLLQVVFLAAIFEERGQFAMGEVAHGIAEKLVRRHPHVFGSEPTADLATLDAQWERIKRAEKAGEPECASLFASIPRQMPALLRAVKIAEKADREGLVTDSWPDASAAESLMHRLRSAVDAKDRGGTEDAMGDLLFAIADMGREVLVDPEQSLRRKLDGLEADSLHRSGKRISDLDES